MICCLLQIYSEVVMSSCALIHSDFQNTIHSQYTCSQNFITCIALILQPLRIFTGVHSVPGMNTFSSDAEGPSNYGHWIYTIVLKYDSVHNNRKLLFLRAPVQRGTGMFSCGASPVHCPEDTVTYKPRLYWRFIRFC